MLGNMKRYNFVEILLSALSWALFAGMLGLLIGGYWVKVDFLEANLRGYEVMRLAPAHTAMVISYIGLALIFVDNMINHLLKFGEHDSHNVIFQGVALAYALPYLITLFVVGFAEDIAWYPFSFFLCYVAAGICDLLFALFYDLDANDYHRGERRSRSARRTRSAHRSHSRARHSKPAPFPLKSEATDSALKDKGTRTAYTGMIVNSYPGKESLGKIARDAVEKLTYLHLDKPLTIDADYVGYARLDGSKHIYVCDKLQVFVRLTDDDWDWITEYVDTKFKGTRDLQKAQSIVAESGVDAEEIAAGKHPSLYESVLQAIWEEYNSRIAAAGESLMSAVSEALCARFAAYTSGNSWLCYCRDADYMGSRAVDLKRAHENDNFVFSKFADSYVTSDFTQEFTTRKLQEIAADFLTNYNKRKLDKESKKYAILDSKSQLDSLSTAICLYLNDKMHAVLPDIGCPPFVDLPITATLKKPIMENDIKCYDSIKFDLHLTKRDAEWFEDFCNEYDNGRRSQDYDKRGIKFVSKHIMPAINEFMDGYRRSGILLGVRPDDTDAPYWAECYPEGKEEPTPMSLHFKCTATTHWEDIPDGTFYAG